MIAFGLGPYRFAALVTGIVLGSVALVWLVWTLISRGAFGHASCPKCGSTKIRISGSHEGKDWLMARMFLAPVRCHACGLRHYNFRWARLDRVEGATPPQILNERI